MQSAGKIKKLFTSVFLIISFLVFPIALSSPAHATSASITESVDPGSFTRLGGDTYEQFEGPGGYLLRVQYLNYVGSKPTQVLPDTQITVQIPAGVVTNYNDSIDVVTPGGTSARFFDFTILPYLASSLMC